MTKKVNKFKPRPILYNGVHWICGLPDEELGPSRRSSVDIGDLCSTNSLYFFSHRVTSKEDFSSLMQEIGESCVADSYKPILYLDCHGSAEEGLVISKTNELISWRELFQMCQKINIATENNLFVILAACYGFNAILPMKINQPTPFNMLLAPETEILVGELEDKMLSFFKVLFETNDVNVALADKLCSMRLYHCEKLLAQILTDYYRKGCIGKNKQKRIDRLLSEYRKERGIADEQSLSSIRSALKQNMREGTNQKLFDKYASLFLMDEKFSYSFNDMIAVLREEKLIV